MKPLYPEEATNIFCCLLNKLIASIESSDGKSINNLNGDPKPLLIIILLKDKVNILPEFDANNNLSVFLTNLTNFS